MSTQKGFSWFFAMQTVRLHLDSLNDPEASIEPSQRELLESLKPLYERASEPVVLTWLFNLSQIQKGLSIGDSPHDDFDFFKWLTGDCALLPCVNPDFVLKEWDEKKASSLADQYVKGAIFESAKWNEWDKRRNEALVKNALTAEEMKKKSEEGDIRDTRPIPPFSEPEPLKVIHFSTEAMRRESSRAFKFYLRELSYAYQYIRGDVSSNPAFVINPVSELAKTAFFAGRLAEKMKRTLTTGNVDLAHDYEKMALVALAKLKNKRIQQTVIELMGKGVNERAAYKWIKAFESLPKKEQDQYLAEAKGTH